jgi:RNA polymerase sigma-70 factor, ECF subfamily
VHGSGESGEPIVRMQDEVQLIQRARQGDLAAVSELYNLHVDRIYQYVRYRTGDDQTAEDITAEVFLRAIESLGSYNDQGAPFVAWLYRIAHARVVDYWRSSKRRQTAPLDDPLLQDGLVMTDDAIDIDFVQHRSLWSTLRQLTDDQQNVIILKFVQGLSNAEIARMMGKTEGAIKALQRRALEALARLLDS